MHFTVHRAGDRFLIIGGDGQLALGLDAGERAAPHRPEDERPPRQCCAAAQIAPHSDRSQPDQMEWMTLCRNAVQSFIGARGHR